MIVVNAIVKTTAADITALKDAIAVMEKASRAEPDCLDYTFSVELSDPDKLRITEKWSTLEALQAHFAMPHMAAFQASMGENPPASIDVKFFEVTEIEPF